ncbi:hypothetical protein [Phaeodactylibacter xiamenensis]|uniref:hypothetical protein n=1 Tax=Phaeodactylibacter xiamenensis TaxID=1524460 RepID=UPI0024A9246E|nr:hypothetical protein [Phaeodactylibacter xiamenensis]
MDANGKQYVYRGDRLAKLSPYAGRTCRGVLQPNGKCIRGKNGNMLVDFDGTKVVRQLRKLNKDRNEAKY